MSERSDLIRQNVERVRQRIADAASRAGREADEISLVAVTKYVDADVARDLVAAGCHDLGESRPQELWKKATALRDLPIRWHQIGHVQRNKLRRTLPLVSLLQSVDSLRVLEAVASWLKDPRTEKPPPGDVRILLEVNVSGDEAKHGFAPDASRRALEVALAVDGLQVDGLMCMAGLGAGLTGARRDFAALFQLREHLRQELPRAALPELSMGMSADFEVAIEEGATMVRVGTALFEGVI